jgi:hypothetical protein
MQVGDEGLDYDRGADTVVGVWNVLLFWRKNIVYIIDGADHRIQSTDEATDGVLAPTVAIVGPSNEFVAKRFKFCVGVVLRAVQRGNIFCCEIAAHFIQLARQ